MVKMKRHASIAALGLSLLYLSGLHALSAGTSLYEQLSISGKVINPNGAVINMSVQATEYTLPTRTQLAGSCILSGKWADGKTFLCNTTPSDVTVASNGKSAYIRIDFNLAGEMHKAFIKLEKRSTGDFAKWCVVSRSHPAPAVNDYYPFAYGNFSAQYRPF